MRKKDLLQFDYGESGQTVYFAVQIENSGGKQGPWSDGICVDTVRVPCFTFAVKEVLWNKQHDGYAVRA